MRRLIAFAGLVGSFVLIGFTGWGDASVTRAHATFDRSAEHPQGEGR